MEPTVDTRYALADLLDRLLDKGVIIQADVIISVAGIPLIGINLRAALAGMETMLQYGVMQEWDQEVRSLEAERQRGWEDRVRGEKIVQVLG